MYIVSQRNQRDDRILQLEMWSHEAEHGEGGNGREGGERNMAVIHRRTVQKAGIHLERGFASMPRRSVKRHIIFCHACPSPAFFSIVCAIVI